MTVTDDDAAPDPLEPEPDTDVDDELDAEDEDDSPRHRRTALFVSLAVAVVLVAFVAVLATRKAATDRVADSPLVDKPAPPLTGATLDGGFFNIADYVGGDEWVVVNFFATWCPPCRTEHPQLIGFDETHTRLGDAVVVSVVFDDDTDEVREYFEDNGGEWPVVADEDSQIVADWGVSGVPETYIVAPSGRVVRKLIGGVTQGGLERIIAEAAAEMRANTDDARSGS